MKNNKTFFIVLVGILSAIATAAYMFLPEITISGHLKLDISDIPAAIAGMTAGPWAGILVVVIKNVFHLMKSDTLGIGELINVIIGSVIVLSLTYGYRLFHKIWRSKKKLDYRPYFSTCILTIILTVAIGFGVNLVFLPLYFQLMRIPASSELIWSFAVGSFALNIPKSVANTVLIYPILLALKSYVGEKNRSKQQNVIKNS